MWRGVELDTETDLFQKEEHTNDVQAAPLARRMRPTSLNEFVGQDHILGQGSLLRRMIESDRLTSILLYGPPGTGKTSLAHVIAHTTRSHFERLSAVSCGVSEIRHIVGQAARRLRSDTQRTILFIDEIHRFNRAQQDVLLPHVEDGFVVLIGTTVENPFFYIVSPLMSRSHLFELRPLSDDDLKRILKRTLDDDVKGFGKLKVEIREEALRFVIDGAEGDARRFLNSLEIAVLSTPPDVNGRIVLTRTIVEECYPRRVLRHDRNGDDHYDTVSAFIKSMRGSDPDAAIYWMARMIAAGEDPRYIARRIIICAAEDVGNADPQALVVACAALTAAQCVGLPEAQIPLAQAALYVSTAPKSNACYAAISKALDDVNEGKTIAVPMHLKDAHYRGAEKLGRGKGYMYPHSFHNGYVDQEYLPQGTGYYEPTDHGYESVIRRRLQELRRRRHEKKQLNNQSRRAP